MKKVIFDLESNGLLDTLTVCHSLVVRDADSGELLLSCTDNPEGLKLGYRPIEEGLSLLSEADIIYAHNGVGFDVPALEKLYPDWTYRGKLMDTLLVAQFRWAHIKELDYGRARRGSFPAHYAGSHMLEAWGYRLGVHKGEYKDWCKQQGIEDAWETWRPEMQTYCEQDTEVTWHLVQKIRRSGGITPLALEVEHKLARYLGYQSRSGWPLDMEKVIDLVGTLSARREELGNELRDHFGYWYAPDGKPKVPKRTIRRKTDTPGVKELVTEGAEYQKVKQVEFNPASRQHIARCLSDRYGWKPASFTPSGQPQVDEEALKGFDSPVTPLLLEYLTVDKRLGQLSEGKQAWLNHITDKGYQGGSLTGLQHIHHRCKQNHAVTHRASHSNPNVAQVPRVGSDYGAECRECWTVPEGWVLVGADASGLELRCLAHYMAKYDGGAYGKVVVEGDIHAENRDALGLTGPDGRHAAKNGFIYPFLYGAGDVLIGSNLRGAGAPIPIARKAGISDEDFDKAIGGRYRKKFLKGLPALKYLVEALKEKVRDPRYLVMPDGRRTYIRHPHAVLNSLLQAAGAIICKLWIVRFADKAYERFGEPGWAGKWVPLGWIHDELQIAARPEIAEELGQILVETIREVGVELEWRCPLDGEAKIGMNWKETH